MAHIVECDAKTKKTSLAWDFHCLSLNWQGNFHIFSFISFPSFCYSNFSSQINLIIKIILSFIVLLHALQWSERRGNETDCKKAFICTFLFFLPLFMCLWHLEFVWISELPETTQIKFYVSLQLNIQLQTVISLVVEIINFRFLCCK